MGVIECKARNQKPKGRYMAIINQPPRDIKPNLEPSTLRNMTQAFLRWYLDGHNVESLPGFLVLVRYWRIYYCHELDKDFPYHLKRKTKELICTVLKFDYGLSETAKVQPPINVDDFFYLLHHAAAVSQVLSLTFSSSPIFSYTEWNDNLGFCVIQDIIEYAFQDGVFASEYIKNPQDIWRYTDVPEHWKSVPIHIKKTKWKIPVFRPGVQDAEGKSAGLEKIGGAYKYRKGAAEQLDRNLTEHQRNHVMGHNRGHIFQAYVNTYGRPDQTLQPCKAAGTPEALERKKLQKETLETVYKEYFENVGNDIIHRNYHGQNIKFVSQTSFVLPERKELAALEFQNRDASTVSDVGLLEDRIRSLELCLDLHHLHVPKGLVDKVTPTELARNCPFPTSFPL
ncbi:FluG protein [Histoplasma capsulatum H143]|uniref:FluG protein n=1 Tax=Ajellomyces capsulatus (strain H143) TaxID=544712 RepID=C6H6F0_AJECH|nr:FluG protein [Histoplasma capsulatum H143]